MARVFAAALISAALGVSLAPAHAADAITYATSGSGDALAVTDAAPDTFDWSGFYAGIFAGVRTPAGDDSGAQVGGGVFAGVNATFDFVLTGAEVAVEGLTGDGDDPAGHADILARGGVLVADNLAVYGLAGYGVDLTDNTGDDGLLLGGGVEYAVNDDVSVRGQFTQQFQFGDDEPVRQVTVGAAFHF